ncbi:hypothetical protein [Sinorhizobium alkalisoli]|nr:hypothetical protein [Sinorhizobium alkalisoli]
MQMDIRLEFEHAYRHPASRLSHSEGFATMTCDALERPERKALLPRELMSGLASGVRTLMRPSYPRLDIGAVSDHMKRDMGFMDGRPPRLDDEGL